MTALFYGFYGRHSRVAAPPKASSVVTKMDRLSSSTFAACRRLPKASEDLLLALFELILATFSFLEQFLAIFR